MIYIFKDNCKVSQELSKKEGEYITSKKFPKFATKCLNHISKKITEDNSEILVLTDEKILLHYNHFFFEGYQKNDSLKMNTSQKKVIENRVIKFHFTDFKTFKSNHERYSGDIIFDDSGMPERLLYTHEFLDDKYIYSLERTIGELTEGLNKKKYTIVDID